MADAYSLTEPQYLNIIPLLAWRTQAMRTFLAQQAAPPGQLTTSARAAQGNDTSLRLILVTLP